MSSSAVLLFRSPEENLPDRYHLAFQAQGYDPFRIISVPVLESAMIDIDRLQKLITSGPEAVYDGVIVTSGRAGAAWREAAERAAGHSGTRDGPDWRSTPFYVVGGRTAEHLSPMPGSSSHRYYPTPSNVLGAQETGNSNSLAQYVINDVRSRRQAQPGRALLPLLYLTGDKTLGTVKNAFENEASKESGCKMETDHVQVYETREKTGLDGDIRRAATSITKTSGTSTWLVFFAPSSARAVLPTLSTLFKLAPPSDSHSGPIGNLPVLIASIGPTTTFYLSSQHDPPLSVDVTASKPAAEILAQEIKSFDRARC